MQILLVDDHRLMREGLRYILEREGLSVVGEAANGREAIDMVRELQPDVVVMDISMPQLNGIEATRIIVSDFPKVKVLALSTHLDRQYILSMLDAGVSGYILKDSAGEEIVQALKTIKKGKKYLSADITGMVMEGYVKRKDLPDEGAAKVLGGRQREVLQLLAEGHTSGEIASRMNITTSTVETHRRNIMKKLGLHSVAELTKYAVREGITSLDQ